MIRILVADDHPIVRKGIECIICESPGLQLATSCDNGWEALQIIRQGGCDMAVLDIGMPRMSGLEVLEAVKNEALQVPVIILSMYEEETFAVRAMRSGASAFITKKHAPEELVAAIEKVSNGRKYLTATLADRFADMVAGGARQNAAVQLSDRELHVLMRLARGERLKSIADEMFLSPKTVSTYRARILDKLKLKTNVELARYAAEEGLVDSPPARRKSLTEEPAMSHAHLHGCLTGTSQSPTLSSGLCVAQAANPLLDEKPKARNGKAAIGK